MLRNKLFCLDPAVATLLLIAAAAVVSLPCRAVTVLTDSEITVPFGSGPLLADPVRDEVYVVDQTNYRLLAFSTTTGQQLAAGTLAVGVFPSNMAISTDGTKIYVPEFNSGLDLDEILVFSLPSLSPLATIPLSFSPATIAATTGGRLFSAEGTFPNVSLVEIDPLSGTVINTFGSTENYYDPLLKTNTTGTDLYVADRELNGDVSIDEYNVSGAPSALPVSHDIDEENVIDFVPDETDEQIYVAESEFNGINVLKTADDDDTTDWAFTSSSGIAVGIGFNSGLSVVFGASSNATEGDIREFNRADGTPLADYVVATDGSNPIADAGIAATSNGYCFYVREPSSFGSLTSILGLLSPTGVAVTLAPSISQTITFPPIVGAIVGQVISLQATDSSGLPITYTLLPGSPATLSGSQLTVTGAGTITVTASQAGNLVFKAATPVTITFIATTTQTISPFANIPPQTYGTPPFPFSVPNSSVGLPVTVTVTGPAKLLGNFIIITGAGLVTLDANQPGTSTVTAAPEVTTSFTVSPASQTIAPFQTIATRRFSPVPFAINFPTSSSGLPVTVSVQSGLAMISGHTITLTGTGTVVLAADQAGNTNYLAASTVTTSFLVTGPPQKITPFKPITTRVYSPTPFTIPLPTASSGLPVTVTVLSGPATISGDVVTTTGVGTVELAANQPGNASFAAAPQVTTKFAIIKAHQTISPFPSIAGVTFGVSPFAITPPTSSSGLPVTVTVAKGPATIAGNVITVTGVGRVELVATQVGNPLYDAARPVITTFTVSE